MRISDTRWFPAFLFFLAALIFCWPLFVHPFNWATAGYHDSDEALSCIATERQTLLEYHQLPFWTPVLGGGQEAAALVFSPALSPVFALFLLFGELIGTKIMVTLLFFFGLWGMYLLSRAIGCSRLAAYLPPVLFFFSSIYALQVAEGVYYNTALAWLPWAILFYLRALEEDKKYITVSALFGLLIFFSGAVYPVLFYLFLFLFFYALFRSATERSWQPLGLLVFLALLVFVLGAVKALPLVDYARKHVALLTTRQHNDLQVLLSSFFSRQQLLNIPRSDLWGLPRNVNYWEFHGAYVGAFPFVFYIVALLRLGRRPAAIAAAGWGFLLLYLFNLAPPVLREPFERAPFLLFQIHPSRLLWMFLFSFSLIAGLGFGIMERRAGQSSRRVWKVLLGTALGLVVLDLYSVNNPILKEAFGRSPEEVRRRPAFVQTWEGNTFERSSNYRLVQENRGLCVDNYKIYGEVLSFCHAVPFGAPKYRGEVYLESGDAGRLRRVTLTPNVIAVELGAGAHDDLFVINQNYDPGWRVTGLQENKVVCRQGLIAARVAPTDRGAVTFHFFPVAFIAGGTISLAGAAVVLFLRGRRILIPALCLLAAANLMACYVVMSVIPAAERASADACGPARHDAVQGAWAYKKGDLYQGTMYLESATAALPHSVSLHRMLKEIYEETGRTVSAQRQQEMIDSLLPPETRQGL